MHTTRQLGLVTRRNKVDSLPEVRTELTGEYLLGDQGVCVVEGLEVGFRPGRHNRYKDFLDEVGDLDFGSSLGPRTEVGVGVVYDSKRTSRVREGSMG